MSAPTKFGIGPTTAAEQLVKSWPPKAKTQPLPKGKPGRAKPADLGITDAGTLRFFVIGDHGGIKDPTLQNQVTVAMEALARPAFVYSVGDWVYFNADAVEFDPQFYEAYAHLNVPFIGIPGNHDGDTTDDPSRKPLDTWMANFCAKTPSIPPASAEYNRETMTQPWCDWTLVSEAVTMIGLYTNVPSGGHLATSQTDWLAAELKAAPTDRPVVVSMHHPPYSIDAHHGGSKKMLTALDTAIGEVGRGPDLVMAGHVHDCQFFTRTEPLSGQVPFIVIGNSGYHNLHKLAPGATPGQPIDGADPEVVFEYGDDSHGGFLEVEASASGISINYHQVDRSTGHGQIDHAIKVQNGKVTAA